MDFRTPAWANTQQLYDLMRPRYRNAFVAGWFPHLSHGGQTLRDIGRRHNASLTVAPSPTVGRPGWIYSYDGNDDYLTVAHDSALNPAEISIAMLVRFTANPANYDMFLQKDVDNNWDNGYGIFYYEGQLQFYYGKGTDAWESPATYTLAAANRDWHYVVCTYDGTSRRIWVDHVPGASNSDSFSRVDGTQDLFIGAAWSEYYTACKLGPIVIFNRAIPDLHRGLWHAVFHPPYQHNLKAGSVGSTVQLDWTDNSDNESGFSIERSTTSAVAGFAEIAAVGGGTTTYNDTDLAADTYWYRLRSYDAAGRYSDYSNVAEVTVT